MKTTATKAKAAPASAAVVNEAAHLKPSVLRGKLDNYLTGMERPKRIITARMAVHSSRTHDIAEGKTVHDPNQCILLIGPSGAGKTFLVET
ncbi:MAG: hypothetical protein E4H01_01515, partial [Lysobacterales bacterium]